MSFVSVLFCLLVWLAGHGMYYLIGKPNNIRYNNYWYVYVSWFLLCACVFSYHFFDLFRDYFTNATNIFYLSFGQFTTILILIALLGVLGYRTVAELKNNNTVEFAKTGLSKVSELIFQQSAFLTITLLLPETHYKPLVAGIILCIVHIPILFFLPLRYCWIFIIGIIFGGALFIYLITRGPIGLLVSYMLHVLFYVIYLTILVNDKKDECFYF